MEYPTTKEQKQVKEVIENRNITVIEKAKRIYKLDKAKGKNTTQYTQMIDEKTEESNVINNETGEIERKQEATGEIKSKSKKLKKTLDNAESIGKNIIKEHKTKEAITKLKSMGFSNAEVKALLDRHDIEDLIDKVEDLENSFRSVIPDLENRLSKYKTKEKVESKGNRINGYKRLNDYSKVTENIEDFVTIAKHDLDEMRIPYKVDRKRSGTVVLLRDVSGSMTGGEIGKLARDITVTLIKLAQKNQHRIAVLDFHSDIEIVKDSKGKVLTNEYNTILIDSMKFKRGYSTCLARALNYIDELIVKEKVDNIPINIFIITDSYVDFDEEQSKMKNAKKLNMVGLWCDVDDDDETDRDFAKTIEVNKGKLYHINKVKDKIVSTLHKEYTK